MGKPIGDPFKDSEAGVAMILCGAHIGASALLTQLERSNLLLLESEEPRAYSRNKKSFACSYEEQGSQNQLTLKV